MGILLIQINCKQIKLDLEKKIKFQLKINRVPSHPKPGNL